MKYKIVIRGKDADPMFIEHGAELMSQWVEGTLPSRMVINNLALYSADIKSITKVDEEPKPTLDETHFREEREYQDFRRNMLSLSIEERANIMRIPNMIWSSFGNREMPEDLKLEIKNRQRAYLEENPGCVFANPKVYRDLMTTHLDNPKKGQLNRMNSYLALSMMKIIENIIQTDLRYSTIKL